MHTMSSMGQGNLRNNRKAKEMSPMEKVYKTMRNAGACSIVIGSVMIVTGLAAGIMAIVSGAALLRRKSEITF